MQTRSLGRGFTRHWLKKAFRTHAEHNKKLANAIREQSEAQTKMGNIASWISMLLGASIVGILGFLVVRGISRSVKSVNETLTLVGRDLDFTLRAPVTSKDELGEMAETLNRLLSVLQGSLSQLKSAATSVAMTATDIAINSTQGASNSEKQSEAAMRMAASMQELSVSISHVGDQAGEAQTLSTQAGELATSGATVITQTIDDINEIAKVVNGSSLLVNDLHEQSKTIQSIVQTIREIADQTSLLALNAAIEAARAGDQGRGFAVVADEVRKLAERSAHATKDITATVASIQERAQTVSSNMDQTLESVQHTVSRTDGARDAIGKIGGSSRDAVGMVSEITRAIKTQSEASISVARLVDEISDMATDGSKAAVHGAETARKMDVLAKEMHQVLATYRL